MKRMFFILFLMLFILLDGCAVRFNGEAESPASALPPSVSPNAEDGKLHTLNDMAARYIHAQSGEARRAAFDAWQGTLLDANGIPAGELSQKEVKNLSILGYLMHFNHCFLASEYLAESGLTDPLYIYHNAPIPTLYRTGWEEVLKQDAYPAADEENGYAIISVKQAEEFIKDVCGVAPSIFQEGFSLGTPDEEALLVKNKNVFIQQGDYIMHDVLVSGYRYLGDGLFYVVFDGDDYGLPDPDEDKRGIIPDFMRLVVKRSDTLWGFTVVAKLKGFWGSPIEGELKLPEGIITIKNQSGRDLQ